LSGPVPVLGRSIGFRGGCLEKNSRIFGPKIEAF
jgi:hypothetical protein